MYARREQNGDWRAAAEREPCAVRLDGGTAAANRPLGRATSRCRAYATTVCRQDGLSLRSGVVGGTPALFVVARSSVDNARTRFFFIIKHYLFTVFSDVFHCVTARFLFLLITSNQCRLTSWTLQAPRFFGIFVESELILKKVVFYNIQNGHTIPFLLSVDNNLLR